MLSWVSFANTRQIRLKNRFAERILTSFSIEEALATFGEEILRLLKVEVQ